MEGLALWHIAGGNVKWLPCSGKTWQFLKTVTVTQQSHRELHRQDC